MWVHIPPRDQHKLKLKPKSMITEIIEKNIKIEYLKRYCKQLKDSIEDDINHRFEMGYEERKEFENSERGKNVEKVEVVINKLETKLQELQKEILNVVLVENGFEKIEEYLYL
jgi:2-oxoglutarate dehydrogenase complex dehydrogenase (E1) component-like enzyme